MKKRENYALQVLAYFWKCASKYPLTLSGALISMPITTLITQFLPPIIVASVLNRLSKGAYIHGDVWASFGKDLVAYALLIVSGGFVAWRFVDFFGWKLEINIQRDIANEVFKHLTEQTADFHANNFGGSLVSDTNKLMSSYVRFMDTTSFQVIPLVSGLFYASIILVHKVPIYVLLLDSFAIFYIVTAFFVTKRTRKLGAIHSASESKQTGFLADAITNVMAVKSFARNTYERQRFLKATNESYDHLRRFARAHQKQQIYFSGVTSAISALSLTVAVISVVSFHANVATVFLIVSYTATIVTQLMQFSNIVLRNYNRSFADARKMVEILALPAEIKDPENPEISKISRGAIEFKDVTFTHNGADKPIFEKLNLRIKPGEKVGLVGHSGSGKSTFTRLLLRFSDLNSGEILIDDQNIAAIKQEDLHDSISYVPQEPLLFHREIRENIAYGNLEADDQAIEAIAKAAHVHDFVIELPKGYHTLVGERGVKLSGGQRQRVAIARAMIKNAPVLVLDEATSALDSESEALIQDALWKLMEGRTTIVIAHRLSTIQRMDRIVVLEDGKITEQGTHKELIHAQGVYADLWNRQSGGFIED